MFFWLLLRLCGQVGCFVKDDKKMYIATYLIDIAALIYLIGLLYSNTTLNSNRKKPFLAGILLVIIIILAEAGTIFTGIERLNLRSLNIFSNVLGFALTPMIPIVITLIFNRKTLTTHRVWLLPTLINIVAAVLSPIFGFIFYIYANNQYLRGEAFFIFIVAYIINYLFLVIRTLDMGKKYNYPIMRKMLALSFFTIAGTSIQLAVPLAYSSWHCVTLALFLYYLLMSEFDSSFDMLTGLYNRANFDKAAREIGDLTALSVIILDIDDFKDVNDTYGHDYGDHVIKTVASVIRESFNHGYRCYRYGGDEFVVIGHETDSEKIEFQLKMMTSTLSEIRKQGNPLPTVSYGYSVFLGGTTLNFDKVLKEADDQMYRFKRVYKTNAACGISIDRSVHR